MYVTHCVYGDTLICQIWYYYVEGQTTQKKYVINAIKLTLRSKINVNCRHECSATQCLMVIHPCARYRLQAGHESVQKDVQTGSNIQYEFGRLLVFFFPLRKSFLRGKRDHCH